uniref:non-specific protein-tyrosine kinase n=1 Tax=Panagrolaimus superbus TaxID=310955 RepID=A0A914YQQ4_9BILA
MDELLYNVLFKEDLLQFAPTFAKNALTKADHFSRVEDDELVSLGIPKVAIRRLRSGLAAKEVKKRMEKRAKKNLPITYVNVSHFDIPPSPKAPQQQQQQQQQVQPQQHQHHEPEIIREEKPSTSNNPIPLALILKEDIHLMEDLGEGSFAVVKRALWKKSEGEKKIDVAVKILREVTEIVKKDVEAEIQTMSKLHHTNLVDLYGVVLSDPMLMVMEFCDGGSLLNRLRSSEKPVLLATQLLNYALQIASGMAYLQQKGYVHRDLATRNVLLKNNDETVKLCDFGLSRLVNEYDQTYDMQGVTRVPFSWCPPEALRYRKFSSASDVWAFGVTVWECFTFGEEPWIGLNALNVLQTTERGERLHKPDKCSQNLYELMLRCWTINPTDRPDFRLLYAILTKVNFATKIAIKDHKPSIPAEIAINKGDKFIVLEEVTPNTVLGQNVTSRQFGHCPKAALDMKTSVSPVPFQATEGRQPIRQAPPKPSTGPVVSSRISESQTSHSSSSLPSVTTTSSSSNRQISSPIRNSFIHAGHGASDVNHSWGDPSSIPDVYLKNPVLKPVVGTDISNAIPIQKHHSQPSIPMKTSVPQHPTSALHSSRSNVSWGSSGNGESFTSVEAWNRSRLEQEPTSARSNQLPPPSYPSQQQQQRSRSPDITMRIQPPPVQPRPKTTLGLPPPTSRKKPSMDEQARSQQAFSWIKDEIKKEQQEITHSSNSVQRPQSASGGSSQLSKEETKARLNGILSEQRKGTTFSINPGENPRTTEERRENGIKVPTGGISVMPKSPPSQNKLSSSHNSSNGNVAKPIGTPMNAIKPSPPSSASHASTVNQISSNFSNLTLVNPQYPQLSPSLSSGPDPFVVSDQLKSIIDKPLYLHSTNHSTSSSNSNSIMSVTTMQSSMTPISVTLAPNLQPSRNSQHFLEPTPLPHFSSNINGSSTRNGTASMMNGNSNQMHHQLHQQQHTILQPSTAEINYPKMSNGFVLPSTAKPMAAAAPAINHSSSGMNNSSGGSFLPPPSPLLTQITAETAKRCQNTNLPMQPQSQQHSNGILDMSSKPPRPMSNNQTRVIPSTGPSSSHTVGTSMISQQQRPIALNINQLRTLSPSPLSRNTPTAPTLEEIYAQPSSIATRSSSAPSSIPSLSEKNELLSKVKSRVNFATDVECCAALMKHHFDIEMAVKQLKIDSLIATALTNDTDLAASALDYCNWDLNQAAIRLMSN